MHRWTREARVSRMLGVFDAGRIINEKAARSQLMGGMIWGVSAALHEGLEIEENGRIANGDLAAGTSSRSTPTFPEVDMHFVQHPDTLHNPMGAKGVGEIGTVGMAAAVANAVHAPPASGSGTSRSRSRTCRGWRARRARRSRART